MIENSCMVNLVFIKGTFHINLFVCVCFFSVFHPNQEIFLIRIVTITVEGLQSLTFMSVTGPKVFLLTVSTVFITVNPNVIPYPLNCTMASI